MRIARDYCRLPLINYWFMKTTLFVFFNTVNFLSSVYTEKKKGLISYECVNFSGRSKLCNFTGNDRIWIVDP